MFNEYKPGQFKEYSSTVRVTAFTLKTIQSGGSSFHLYDAKPGDLELYKEHGFEAVDYVPSPKGSVWLKCGYFVMRSVPREYTFSPEGVVLHKRVCAAWDWATPPSRARQQQRSKEWGRLHSEFFSLYHSELMPKREEIEAGITLQEVTKRLVQTLEGLMDRCYSRALLPALEAICEVLRDTELHPTHTHVWDQEWARSSIRYGCPRCSEMGMIR